MMFRSILDKLGVSKNQCPTFYYYINRHIEVDDNKHGPIAISLLNEICKNNRRMKSEALQAAMIALKARISFWDKISIIIKRNKSTIK